MKSYELYDYKGDLFEGKGSVPICTGNKIKIKNYIKNNYKSDKKIKLSIYLSKTADTDDYWYLAIKNGKIVEQYVGQSNGTKF